MGQIKIDVVFDKRQVSAQTQAFFAEVARAHRRPGQLHHVAEQAALRKHALAPFHPRITRHRLTELVGMVARLHEHLVIDRKKLIQLVRHANLRPTGERLDAVATTRAVVQQTHQRACAGSRHHVKLHLALGKRHQCASDQAGIRGAAAQDKSGLHVGGAIHHCSPAN